MSYYTKHQVTCYLGIIGCGKTTYAVKIAQHAFREKKKVYTNIQDIKGAYLINITDLMKYDITDGVVIWDEMGIAANGRDWSNFPKSAREWFKLSRHMKCAVHVFSQALDFDVTIPRITCMIFTMRKGLILPITWLTRWRQIRDTDIQTGYPRWIWQPSRFPSRFVWRPMYYKFFNSWDIPSLPPLPPERLIGHTNSNEASPQ